MPLLRLIIIGLGVFTVLVLGGSRADSVTEPGDRERFETLLNKGNFKDAYEGYRGLALDPKTDPKLVGADLKQAMQCLRKLGRVDEIDVLYETAVAIHPEELAFAPDGGRELSQRLRKPRVHRRGQVPPSFRS